MPPFLLIEYDDTLVRQLMERITVFEEKIKLEFKSGVVIEINM
jgi:site-specific DNA recombinase